MTRTVRCVSAALIAGLLLAGCAGMTKLTPRQERVYADWEACQRETGVITIHLTRVNPDGSFGYEGYANEAPKMYECLRLKGYRMGGW